MDSYRVGLTLHPTRDVSGVVRTIVDWAGRHGVGLVVRAEDKARVPPQVAALPSTALATGCDALISIGGDGTMLGTLRLAVEHPVPVLGVHLGQFGFLVEVQPEGLPAALDRLLEGQFTVEPQSCLACTVCGDDVVAFNDIVLGRHPGEGFVVATLAIDGQQYGYYRCDSLIVSTPTGSTAYSYAAGGPLVSPAAQAVVVTPSAPMSGISRPVVLSSDEVLRLELHTDSARAAVEVDGRVIKHIEDDGAIEVRYRRNAGLVVRMDPRRHRERSQLRLSLLDLPLLPEQLRELLPAPLRDEFDRRQPPPTP
ncbi:NAD(+)/NADH kinase [Micromonospora sp. RTGN7]|uniref:NAD(+)/NADH kinase n=1 Tax=Micromonospora sp. RTGN7 TaxID=3016526 RepID=UPI0029FF520F|nr:NAD(+)/NADH kinase [Micromonospora sp. RTGN7]